ncbi:MAG: cob(I)yrinic acid a,c-diamide adenosyltransferase, partial [Muribaculaceae bacterium]|nr:cob(I)yrinic acid a,c-diamide adenosyltransferase [Muribaculaceae bacterium]
MKSKIYTLTGDAGTTSLVGGKRVSKDNIRVEAYGTLDELNAYLGLLAHNSKLDQEHMPAVIRHIQNKLFNIGAYLADDRHTATLHGLTTADVEMLEQHIDEWDATLPPMQGFILPGGSRLSAMCDVCRTLTRRAERRIVTLAHQSMIDAIVLQYLNRLSDFFFVFARYNNISNQVEE